MNGKVVKFIIGLMCALYMSIVYFSFKSFSDAYKIQEQKLEAAIGGVCNIALLDTALPNLQNNAYKACWLVSDDSLNIIAGTFSPGHADSLYKMLTSPYSYENMQQFEKVFNRHLAKRNLPEVADIEVVTDKIYLLCRDFEYVQHKFMQYGTDSLSARDYFFNLLDSANNIYKFQREAFISPVNDSYAIVKIPLGINNEYMLHNAKMKLSVPKSRSYILKSLAPNVIRQGILLIAGGLIVLILVILLLLKLNSLYETKTLIINNIAHELKTPIATIQVARTMLEEYNNKIYKDEKMGKIFTVIERQNEKMNMAVNKIFNPRYNEERNHSQPASIEETDQLIRKIISDFSLLYPQVTFKYNFYGNKNKYTRISLSTLNIALTNIIDNACNYRNGDVQALISCHAESSGNLLIIQISDNGIGIGKKYQNRIFQKFYRVGKDDIHNVKGMGIGLYQANQLIKKGGGYITVKSKPGEGSQFSCYIPAHDKQ